MLPKAVRELTRELTRLPGVGPKTAERLALHFMRQPRSALARLSEALATLHDSVQTCTICYNLAETTVCGICASTTRDRSIVCVVEDALDVEALEKTQAYQGLYHVLGGVLSPIEGVGPEQLTLNEFLLRAARPEIQEIIIALDHTMESDATTRYIMQRLAGHVVQVTRLAHGLPTGGDLEFADTRTLAAALSGRRVL